MNTTCPWLTDKQLVAQLKKAKLDTEPLILKALALVKSDRAHGGKTRLGGGPVLQEHIYPVTSHVLTISKGLPKERIILRVVATLGHDLDEDTEVKLNEIREIFGDDVARLIEILTDTGKSDEQYYSAIQNDDDASIIKICDRLNNARCAHKMPKPSFIIDFCEETNNFVLPWGARVCTISHTEMTLLVTQLLTQVSK